MRLANRMNFQQKKYLYSTLFLYMLFVNIWFFYWAAIYQFAFFPNKTVVNQFMDSAQPLLIFVLSLPMTTLCYLKMNSASAKQIQYPGRKTKRKKQETTEKNEVETEKLPLV